MLAYPIAAFARIVAEDRSLHARYGADARAATTAILEVVEAFRPEMLDPALTPGCSNPFVAPMGSRLLTPNQCSQGYQEALKMVYAAVQAQAVDLNRCPATGNPYGTVSWDKQRIHDDYGDCSTVYYDQAGYPLPHNQYVSFVMALIELSRALDTVSRNRKFLRLLSFDHPCPIKLLTSFSST